MHGEPYRTPGDVTPREKPFRLRRGDKVFFERPDLVGQVTWVGRVQGDLLAGVQFEKGGFVQTGADRFTLIKRPRRQKKRARKKRELEWPVWLNMPNVFLVTCFLVVGFYWGYEVLPALAGVW